MFNRIFIIIFIFLFVLARPSKSFTPGLALIAPSAILYSPLIVVGAGALYYAPSGTLPSLVDASQKYVKKAFLAAKITVLTANDVANGLLAPVEHIVGKEVFVSASIQNLYQYVKAHTGQYPLLSSVFNQNETNSFSSSNNTCITGIADCTTVTPLGEVSFTAYSNETPHKMSFSYSLPGSGNLSQCNNPSISGSTFESCNLAYKSQNLSLLAQVASSAFDSVNPISGLISYSDVLPDGTSGVVVAKSWCQDFTCAYLKSVYYRVRFGTIVNQNNKYPDNNELNVVAAGNQIQSELSISQPLQDELDDILVKVQSVNSPSIHSSLSPIENVSSTPVGETLTQADIDSFIAATHAETQAQINSIPGQIAADNPTDPVVQMLDAINNSENITENTLVIPNTVLAEFPQFPTFEESMAELSVVLSDGMDQIYQNLITHEPFASFLQIPSFFDTLSASPEIPVYHIKLPWFDGKEINIDLDFAPLDKYVTFFRHITLIVSSFGMIFFIIKVWV